MAQSDRIETPSRIVLRPITAEKLTRERPVETSITFIGLADTQESIRNNFDVQKTFVRIDLNYPFSKTNAI